ncbi:MAG TPA: hypothetical protein VLE89_02925, partial [Chlamydiales bacterium]|nr:hypothetical protein [Chlamydiales bacterium]
MSSLSEITMDVSCKQTLGDYLDAQVGAEPVSAELVGPKEVRAPGVYKRFLDSERKEAFRNRLIETIKRNGTPQQAERFLALAKNLDVNGAVVFGAILKSESFQKLIEAYTKILAETGSKSWLHSYVNLANHPNFLTNKEFNAAFTHPLLIALVS